MKALQNVLNYIIRMQGISVTIKDQTDMVEHTMLAAQSNYFRTPSIEEEITGQGRSYVISAKDLSFVPTRGDQFNVSADEYYSIVRVDEMRALSQIVGYRLFLE